MPERRGRLEVGRQTGGCGEESHNHVKLHNGRGGEGLSGWGCFYEALQQQHANERLDKTTEQESSGSLLLALISANLFLFLPFK